MNFMNQLIVLFFLLLVKRANSVESPIAPLSSSFFKVNNWTSLVNWENGNKTDTFAELFELIEGGDEKSIGKVYENGNLYNDIQDVSLCQRRFFQIKVNGGESASYPLIWSPPIYHNVSFT